MRSTAPGFFLCRKVGTVSGGGTADTVTVNDSGTVYIVNGGKVNLLAFDPWRKGNINSDGDATVIYLKSDAKVYCGNGAEIDKGDYCRDLTWPSHTAFSSIQAVRWTRPSWTVIKRV